MNVDEIFDLAKWYKINVGAVLGVYSELQQTLHHNASPQQKRPVKDILAAVVNQLKSLPMTDLNLQQVEHLDEMGVGRFLGLRGASFVEEVVTQSGYDPATSANEVTKARQKIEHALQVMDGLVQSLHAADFVDTTSCDELPSAYAQARIQFRQDASIENVSELKKWSNDWNDIVRGIGHLIGETPHDLQITGASKGSIIVCVMGSVSLISILAFMSKKVSGIILDALRVQNAIEDLRHKRISNQIVEKSLRDDLEERQARLEDSLVEELKEKANGSYSGESEGHLNIAVKKYINFSKKGGEVDFLQPPEADFNDEDDQEEYLNDALVAQELRGLIAEIREIKNETLLLGDSSGETTEL